MQYDATLIYVPLIMSWFVTNFIAAFLLPPLNILLLSLTGLLLWHKHQRASLALLGLSFGLLWLLSTPFVAESMLHTLEYSSPGFSHSASTSNNVKPVDAIVVLGGGSYFLAPEYAGDTVSSASLQRLRYAATLYRQINKPILLTGGSPLGNSNSEAEQMKYVLEQEFNTPVRWTEEESNNTLESARNCFHLLHESGIKRIALITHAWHMPRSLQAFEAAGFEVIPAPTAYTTRYQTDLMTFLPNANALHDSQIFWHEIIGIVWYRLKS